MSEGHSAYKSWRIYFDRAILKVAPALGKKSSAQLVFSIIMIILALFGMLGIGIYLDGDVIHPPAQFTGVCPPPARITNGGCFVTQVQVITVNGQASTTYVQVPSGTILTPTQGRP